jgi:hypothetical protein
MAKSKKAVRFQKIPLKELLETLQTVYNQGADYIDISGIPDEQQDIIGIHVLEEYLSDDLEDGDDEEDDTLSEEDLNKLI